MTFVRKTANCEKIKDNVFWVSTEAKKDIAENGPENVVNATIGSLYGEDGKLVAMDEVFNHYDALDHRQKAAYASSFRGNIDYRIDVFKWVTQNANVDLKHCTLATPGGSGAVSMAILNLLDAGETIILPDVAWGNYKTMCEQFNVNFKTYKMFDGDNFNLNSVKETVNAVKATQDKIVLLVNDPCHNPTGYSMTCEEWKELIDFANEVSREVPVVIIDDIAYIDFSNDLENSRKYQETWNDISDNVMIFVAFSCSKTLTSYGLRCGAGVIMAKTQEAVTEVEIVMEKTCRAVWSNIPNAAMINFVWLVNEGKDAFLKEKQSYIDIMKTRSSLFLKEAKEAGLDTYPYKEGFFVTLRIEDPALCKKFHEALMANHIYAVQVFHGIRVAVCSLPVSKVEGLAHRMKKILDEVK